MADVLATLLGAAMLAPLAILAVMWLILASGAAIYKIRWEILGILGAAVCWGFLMLFAKYGIPAYVGGWESVLELVHGPR